MTNARTLASLDGLSRAEWLQLRRHGIGSSDAPAVLNWSQWSSPWQVYLDKIGEIPVDSDPNEAMVWGNRLEAVVANAFAEEQDVELLTPSAIYQHPERDWQLASPDRFIVDDRRDEIGLLEVKTVSAWKAGEWSPAVLDADGVLRGGEAPAAYIAQVQHQHAVMGTDWGYLAALLGGNQLCIVEVPRAPEFVQMLSSIEEGFWNDHVLPRQPPPIDGRESTEEVLKRLFAESDPEGQIVLDDDIAAVLADYHAAHAAEKAATEAKRLAKNRICEALGEAEEGVLPDGTRLVTWRPSPTTRIDINALKLEQPEIASKYEVTTVARTLRPSRSKAAREALAEITPQEDTDGDD